MTVFSLMSCLEINDSAHYFYDEQSRVFHSFLTGVTVNRCIIVGFSLYGICNNNKNKEKCRYAVIIL